MPEGDIEVQPVNMMQSMSIAAIMVHALIAQAFIKADDTEEEKVALTYTCLAVFFLQLCMPANHKDKMVGVLKAIITELESV